MAVGYFQWFASIGNQKVGKHTTVPLLTYLKVQEGDLLQFPETHSVLGQSSPTV